MASLSGDRPGLPAPLDLSDPFVTNSNNNVHNGRHHRYSTFDYELFAAGPGSSPRQAKRSLEAHLAETERRLEEAGKLGTALVSQRKAIEEQLEEVEKLQTEAEINPDLKQKLIEIEKEYNDLSRESSRVLLPKQRVPSSETNPGSPFAPEGRIGRRSLSPSKFDGHATASPTKLSVPNRKARNQPTHRVHDIEFAAEISTSLIEQVRNLQSVLAERDDEVKDLKNDNAALDFEAESLQQRVKALDESENRYKEENWNLETRLQEFATQQREASDREKKLTQALSIANLEKLATQKELDEVKLSNSKLAEEFAASVKHHDIELGTAKRNISTGEGERAMLQRKIDELTSQNQELAKAFSIQRGRAFERETGSGTSEEDFETVNDNRTPEHSPPPSPVKLTPRHSFLETETLKSSLHHAQRTIQSQRGLIHREKTEKLELRRIVQELRDDLERARDNAAPVPTRKSRKPETSKDFRKPPRLLGSFRTSRQEIINEDDPEWEDKEFYHSGSPRTSFTSLSSGPRQSAESIGSVETLTSAAPRDDSSEHFDSANEASESAFETANERATETEDYQTGNEGFSDDAETETESIRGFGKMKHRPNLPASLAKHQPRKSFDSTASTSADEDDLTMLRTPTTSIAAQRNRSRLNRGLFGRYSRQNSEELYSYSSPGSYVSSAHGTPQQSLFAELQGDIDGSDGDSMGIHTPGLRSIRSVTPGSTRRALSPAPAVPALPRAIMVDHSTMTDPTTVTESSLGAALPTLHPLIGSSSFDKRPMTMESVIHHSSADMEPVSITNRDDPSSRPLFTLTTSDTGAQHDPDMEARLAQSTIHTTDQAVQSTPPALGLSSLRIMDIEPVEEELLSPATLSLTPITIESVEPLAEPEIPRPMLSLSLISAENLAPIAKPDAPQPQLVMTPIQAQILEPVAEPKTPLPTLSISSVYGQDVEPAVEPAVPSPILVLSSIFQEEVEPVATPVLLPMPSPAPVVQVQMPEPPKLSISNISAQGVEPIVVPEVVVPRPTLGLSPIYAENHAPLSEPEAVPLQAHLDYSFVVAEQVEPIEELVANPAPSFIAAEHAAPVAESPIVPPTLSISTIATEALEPISPVHEAPALSVSQIGFSGFEFVEIEPILPSMPWNDVLHPSKGQIGSDRPKTPRGRTLGPGTVFGSQQDASLIIAEDDTRQFPSDMVMAQNVESKQPFREISNNAGSRPTRKSNLCFSDQGAQTFLTSGEIDDLFRVGSVGHKKTMSASSIGTPGTTGTVKIHRPASGDSSPSVNQHRGFEDVFSESDSLPRLGSVASGRSSLQDAPPLPTNHRELIQAARTNSFASGTMGPPIWPASTLKNRPQTPQSQRPTSGQSGAIRRAPIARTRRSDSIQSRAADRLAVPSRQSSVSSFASELDSRFNMYAGLDPSGFGPNTDPRMIQAITQTMIGEYLWKYTRKTGREGMSEKRHRRYFWVHPYTRTLYWGDRDPSSAGRAELRTKSVPIEAVRVVTDDNPMPPGLHRKSLVVIAPGRTLKFTCTTGQRHETWFNALSYLLMRTNADGMNDAEELAGQITQDDVNEFNPQPSSRTMNGAGSNVAPSLYSYQSRATRNDATHIDVGIPTLTPKKRGLQVPQESQGSLRKLSGYWKGSGNKLSGTFTLRGRGAPSPTPDIYEASEAHDSAEDLREMIERQDREADRLENVRACCDGKHDVGSLPHQSKRGGRHSFAQARSGPSPTPPVQSMRLRA